MPCRVLVVEDEPLVAESLISMMTRGGHTVCGKAASAAGAIYLAKINVPDIVLVDVKLAGTRDGVEAVRAILAAQECGVVFVTAYADEKTNTRIRSAAPEAVVLSKPVAWSDVEAACARVGPRL